MNNHVCVFFFFFSCLSARVKAVVRAMRKSSCCELFYLIKKLVEVGRYLTYLRTSTQGGDGCQDESSFMDMISS